MIATTVLHNFRIKPRVPIEKRNRIANLIRLEMPYRRIAEMEGVHNTTVERLKRKIEDHQTVLDLAKSGRPRIFTERDERNLVRMIASGTHNTAVDLHREVTATDNRGVSVSTIRRVLQRHGLHGRVKRKMPLLRKRHRQSRTAFARKYRNWTVKDWSRVIWTAESKFTIWGSGGREYCWKKPGEQLQSLQVKPTVKHSGCNVMVWCVALTTDLTLSSIAKSWMTN